MINYFDLEKQIEKNDIKNVYVLCGTDENLINKSINSIIDKSINDEFKDLNFVKIDGDNTQFDVIENACETLPFMSDKKVVLVYRADFLFDEACRSKKDKEKIYKKIHEYAPRVPSHCILIIYNIFKNDRDKPGKNLKQLDKVTCLVKVDKLKGNSLKKVVKQTFEKKGKKIAQTELSLFCAEIDNNMNIIENEVEKLCCYTDEREITKEDIYALAPQKTDKDIFNLVDFISQKKIKNSLDILNELLFKGEAPTYILYMIERQFRLLFQIKLSMQNGKTKDQIVSNLRLNPYICEKMMTQCRKFTIEQIEKSIELCLETEKRLKTMSIDNKIELEMLVIDTMRA